MITLSTCMKNGSLYDGMSLTNANASWRKLMRLMARAFPQRFAPGAPVFSHHHRLSLGNPDLNKHYKFTQSSPDLVEHRRLSLGTPDCNKHHRFSPGTPD
ncbi:Hypothetical predicted protein [Paramuricea clavata]|uniref:Uncharacterized protein n=1 Tax=Paramuricea clavata TaxID=317549 RepID=A0A7D9IR30_PARCT|nr:Hypothetical predicted protein [Paramuricea clavata]